MTDSRYTLVIPTYNRPDSLARLLRHLRAHEVGFDIHVLDSSRPEGRAENARTIASLGMACRHVGFPEEIHPFDKFREGIAAVETPFCGLCADDDILLVDGLRASIRFLAEHPDHSVAHGYYFQFALTDAQIQVTTITYYTPDYDMAEPLGRLQALMRHYQALTYGTYRTEVLARVFDRVQPVTSILGRELLSSALAVVHGKVARLPVLFHGRNLGPSSSYINWHPLEWLIRDPGGLFGEYMLYRDLLLKETLAMPDNRRDATAAARIIDLIHMHYLVRHAPDEVFDDIIAETFAGTEPAAIFGSPPVTMALIRAANEYRPLGDPAQQAAGAAAPASPPASAAPAPAAPAAAPRGGRLDRLFRFRRPAAPPAGPPARPAEAAMLPAGPVAPEPISRDIDGRRYLLSPAFLSAMAENRLDGEGNGAERLIRNLQTYR